MVSVSEQVFDRTKKLKREILGIYTESKGRPAVKPKVECPLCKNKTDHYDCFWDVNKHILFYCDSCEFLMRE